MTGEFIRTTERKSIKGIKVSPDIFNKIPWQLHLELYLNQTMTPWH